MNSKNDLSAICQHKPNTYDSCAIDIMFWMEWFFLTLPQWRFWWCDQHFAISIKKYYLDLVCLVSYRWLNVGMNALRIFKAPLIAHQLYFAVDDAGWLLNRAKYRCYTLDHSKQHHTKCVQHLFLLTTKKTNGVIVKNQIFPLYHKQF